MGVYKDLLSFGRFTHLWNYTSIFASFFSPGGCSWDKKLKLNTLVQHRDNMAQVNSIKTVTELLM